MGGSVDLQHLMTLIGIDPNVFKLVRVPDLKVAPEGVFDDDGARSIKGVGG